MQAALQETKKLSRLRLTTEGRVNVVFLESSFTFDVRFHYRSLEAEKVTTFNFLWLACVAGA